MRKILSDADEKELAVMAEDVRKKREAEMKFKVVAKSFLSRSYSFHDLMLAVGISGFICTSILFAEKLIREYRGELVWVDVSKESSLAQEDKNKHWANVLVLIHERDAKRAAEIIANADKPNRLLHTEPFYDYENRSYLITRELEKTFKSKNIRYQRKEYVNETLLQAVIHNAGAPILLEVDLSPWINW